MDDERILSSDEVLSRLPFRSRVTLWRMCRDGRFPPPVRVGKRTLGWRKSTADAAIERLASGEG